MSEKIVPVAGQKEPQPRPKSPGRTDGITINVNSPRPDRKRPDQGELKQHEDTAKPAPASEPEAVEKPPIYDKPVRLNGHNSPREARYATPLAATLFARFDPNDPREQPAEHAIFVDRRLRTRGYI